VQVRQLLAILFFVLVASSVMAQSNTRPFTFDVVSVQQEPATNDSVRVDIYIAVPYQAVSFLSAGDKYVADYGTIIQITDPALNKLLLDKYQAKSIIEPVSEREARQEMNVQRADASQYSFTLLQNKKYEIRISIQDLSTHKGSDTTIEYTTKRIAKDSVGLSDILLYRSRRGAQVMPLINSDITKLNQDESGLFLELYNGAASVPYGVVTRMSAAERFSDESYQVGSVAVATGQKREPLLLPLIPHDLWVGDYNLQVFLLPDVRDTALHDEEQLRKRALAISEKTVTSNSSSGGVLTAVLRDPDEAIDQLELIASIGELDSLREAQNPRQKRAAVLEFWRKRNLGIEHQYANSTPMEVFYKRVEFANQNFQGTSKGWRTDRGRVYIQLGKPTLMDRHPYSVDEKPYEEWEYYDLRVRYYFVDQYLFGDYRLTSVPPPAGVFLWQRDSY